MKRVTNTNKSITSQAVTGNPSVPSMGAGDKTKVHFTRLPLLSNFVKSQAMDKIEDRKVGIYKLKKYDSRTTTHYELEYKLKQTSYYIQSRIQLKVKGSINTDEGNITINKGFFKSKNFQLKELPINIVDSINDNIIAFNEQYGNKLDLINDVEIKAEQKKKNNFFNGLDT